MGHLKIIDDAEAIAIGTRVRRAREEKRISQPTLAAKLGVSQQLMSRYERGEIVPTIVAMKKIAVAIGVNPCVICGCCNAAVGPPRSC
jgi:ribosome-binding protein aMBF1 (putative translation factor)